jgi:hypothetical protein
LVQFQGIIHGADIGAMVAGEKSNDRTGIQGYHRRSFLSSSRSIEILSLPRIFRSSS